MWTECKVLGMVAAERPWWDVKHIKKDEAADMGDNRLEMQEIVYTSYRLDEVRMRLKEQDQEPAEGNSNIWGDDDEAFNLQLENFAISTTTLIEELPLPKRTFRCWV